MFKVCKTIVDIHICNGQLKICESWYASIQWWSSNAESSARLVCAFFVTWHAFAICATSTALGNGLCIFIASCMHFKSLLMAQPTLITLGSARKFCQCQRTFSSMKKLCHLKDVNMCLVHNSDYSTFFLLRWYCCKVHIPFYIKSPSEVANISCIDPKAFWIWLGDDLINITIFGGNDRMGNCYIPEILN